MATWRGLPLRDLDERQVRQALQEAVGLLSLRPDQGSMTMIALVAGVGIGAVLALVGLFIGSHIG